MRSEDGLCDREVGNMFRAFQMQLLFRDNNEKKKEVPVLELELA